MPSWIWGVASIIVLLCTLALLAALAWGTARVSRASEEADAPPAPAHT